MYNKNNKPIYKEILSLKLKGSSYSDKKKIQRLQQILERYNNRNSNKDELDYEYSKI